MFPSNQECMPSTLGINPRRSTISERLQTRKNQLEAELAEVNTTLTLLLENPKVQDIFDAMSKINM
mgnify:CR=1 FL=1